MLACHSHKHLSGKNILLAVVAYKGQGMYLWVSLPEANLDNFYPMLLTLFLYDTCFLHKVNGISVGVHYPKN
jgi:hypothetical protein